MQFQSADELREKRLRLYLAARSIVENGVTADSRERARLLEQLILLHPYADDWGIAAAESSVLAVDTEGYIFAFLTETLLGGVTDYSTPQGVWNKSGLQSLRLLVVDDELNRLKGRESYILWSNGPTSQEVADACGALMCSTSPDRVRLGTQAYLSLIVPLSEDTKRQTVSAVLSTRTKTFADRLSMRLDALIRGTAWRSTVAILKVSLLACQASWSILVNGITSCLKVLVMLIGVLLAPSFWKAAFLLLRLFVGVAIRCCCFFVVLAIAWGIGELLWTYYSEGFTSLDHLRNAILNKVAGLLDNPLPEGVVSILTLVAVGVAIVMFVSSLMDPAMIAEFKRLMRRLLPGKKPMITDDSDPIAKQDSLVPGAKILGSAIGQFPKPAYVFDVALDMCRAESRDLVAAFCRADLCGYLLAALDPSDVGLVRTALQVLANQNLSTSHRQSVLLWASRFRGPTVLALGQAGS